MTDAKTQSSDDDKAKTETKQQASALGSADARKAAAAKPKADAKASAESGEAGKGSATSLSAGEFRARGILMSILIRMPPAMRYGSDGEKLDDMMNFVMGYDTAEEREVAVELIKAISETSMQEIAGTAYKQRVEEAMSVIHGDAVQTYGIRDGHSAEMAAQRLNMSVSGLGLPPEHELIEARNRGLRNEVGDEQKAAYARLYGEPAPS